MKVTKSIKNKLILVYNFTLLVDAIILYNLIPILLNYGKGTINTAFDKEMSSGLYYYQQIILLASFIGIILTIALSIMLRDIDKHKYYKNKYEETNDLFYKNKIDRIKKICFNLPGKWSFAITIFPVIAEFIFLLCQLYISIADIKLLFLMFIVATVSVSVANIYVKKVLNKVLIDLENNEILSKKSKSMTNRILLEVVPILCVGILFTFLVVSSNYEQSKSELLRKYYNMQFSNLHESTTYKDLEYNLKKVELSNETDVLFIIDPEWNFVHQTGEIGDFFKSYAQKVSLDYNYAIYGYYGTYIQGVMYPVVIDGETWYIGAQYSIYTDQVYFAMLTLLLLIFFVNVGILYYFTKNLTTEIQNVTSSLKDINTNNELYKQLYITSQDEIGELTKEYNKISNLTKSHVLQIEKSQDILVEKERLASLGQMIGGIAHNLKTPIMSISGATEGLKDLTNEYRISVGDVSVTLEDHQEIANDMEEWINKIKTHTSYMSDVITAVKGQAVALSTTTPVNFTLDELLKQVDILMRHELKNALVILNIRNEVGNNVELYGNINSLVQVINNIISNAIQSYQGATNKDIDLTISKEEANLVISIKDYGIGMSKEVQDKLFKSMITTKGKNGTGLGLFMSYSNIKAHFNGDIKFISEQNKGTTFYIILPLQ